MTRTHTKRPVWVWQCDECGIESDFAYLQAGLPLPVEMRKRGWFIAEKWGDKCPMCVQGGESRG